MNLVSNFTKWWTALLLLSLTGLAYADDCNSNCNKCRAGRSCCPLLRDGPYIGAQIGYDSYRLRDKFFLTNPGLGARSVWILNGTGPVGGIFLGFGMTFLNFYYFGTELYGNFSGADARINATIDVFPVTYFAKFRARSTWGIDFLPGLRFTDTSVAYIRLGGGWGNFKAEETGNFLGFPISDAKTHTSSGFKFGFGLETVVDGLWSVRGDYTHTSYGSFRTPTRVTFNHPTDNQIMVGVVYHLFC